MTRARSRRDRYRNRRRFIPRPRSPRRGKMEPVGRPNRGPYRSQVLSPHRSRNVAGRSVQGQSQIGLDSKNHGGRNGRRNGRSRSGPSPPIVSLTPIGIRSRHEHRVVCVPIVAKVAQTFGRPEINPRLSRNSDRVSLDGRYLFCCPAGDLLWTNA